MVARLSVLLDGWSDWNSFAVLVMLSPMVDHLTEQAAPSRAEEKRIFRAKLVKKIVFVPLIGTSGAVSVTLHR
jgi:hypothetical protein